MLAKNQIMGMQKIGRSKFQGAATNKQYEPYLMKN